MSHQHTILKKYLSDIGLSTKQAQIYLCLIEIGQAPASSIARRTHINRTNIYSNLQQMIGYGYIQSVIKNRITYFSAVSPNHLLSKQQYICERLEESLPLFHSLANSGHHKPHMEYYEGLAGVQSLYQRILDESSNKEIVGFLSQKDIDPTLLTYLYDYIVPQRIKIGIIAKILVPNTTNNRKYASKQKEQHKEVRYINEDILQDTPCEINLFGESKIAIILYKSDIMCGIYFDSVHLYKVLYSFFITFRTIAGEKHLPEKKS